MRRHLVKTYIRWLCGALIGAAFLSTLNTMSVEAQANCRAGRPRVPKYHSPSSTERWSTYRPKKIWVWSQSVAVAAGLCSIVHGS